MAIHQYKGHRNAQQPHCDFAPARPLLNKRVQCNAKTALSLSSDKNDRGIGTRRELLHTCTLHGVAMLMTMRGDNATEKGDSTEVYGYGVDNDDGDTSKRRSKDCHSADRDDCCHNKTTSWGSQQQDKKTNVMDAIERQLAQGRARAAIEDERIDRTREKVDSMWQSLE
eukprot:jgi/Picsp_1/363/NSC_00361-R1_---NA---